jgi:hypothetical protein
MFDLFLTELNKIKETVEILEAQHGNDITPEALMTEITFLEQLSDLIDTQLKALRSQAENIIPMGEEN